MQPATIHNGFLVNYYDSSHDFASFFWGGAQQCGRKFDCVAKIGQDWSGLVTSCFESSHYLDLGQKSVWSPISALRHLKFKKLLMM